MFAERFVSTFIAVAAAAVVVVVSGTGVDIGDPIGISKLPIPHLLHSYDFIVIGSGSSGSVVAARLSENPAHTVLLLEAGGDGSIITEVPGMVGATLNSNLDWKYK